MNDMKIYTPEGVQDILGNISYGKRKIESKIMELFMSFATRKYKPQYRILRYLAVEKN